MVLCISPSPVIRICRSAIHEGYQACLLGFVLLISGCTQGPTDQRQTLYVFGTLLEIHAYTDDASVFRDAVAELELMFAQMHKDWHAWDGEGELVRLNRALAQSESFEASEALQVLLIQGRDYSEQSEGLFNPALGRLIALWGFHSDLPPGGPPPTAQAIRELVAAAPEMHALNFEGRWLSSANPTVQLDLGAYAKGVALNMAIDKLRSAGIQHAIVNAGGDLCVAGRHGDRPWRVGVRHPQGEGVIASLEAVDGECVLTSGNYERYREFDGIRYAHILDPRSGYPVEHVASVTVIARNGGLADAAATALSVAGPQAWERIAGRMQVDQVMLVDEGGQVHLTPAMQARIHFETEIAEIHVAE